MNSKIKSMLKFLLPGGLLLILGLTLWFLIREKNSGKTVKFEEKAEKEMTIYLMTDEENLVVGEKFKLFVYIEGEGAVVDGVEFILNYDPQTIRWEKIEEGNFFSLYPQKTISESNGQVRVIALQNPGETKSLTKEMVVVLSGEGLKKGETSFDFDLSKTHAAGYGGQELLRQTKPLTIKID